MAMKEPPWDQRAARILVRPLIATPVKPNQITVMTAVIALIGCGLLATGDVASANWGAGLFVTSRFLDHFDGELARQKKMSSRLGYYLDYAAGGLSYGALFLALGIAYRDGWMGPWALAIGIMGMAAALVSVFTNLGIDRATSGEGSLDAVGYPGYAGFELEDGIYLLAPVTWIGLLEPFFIAASVGAGLYIIWSSWNLWRLRRQPSS